MNRRAGRVRGPATGRWRMSPMHLGAEHESKVLPIALHPNFAPRSLRCLQCKKEGNRGSLMERGQNIAGSTHVGVYGNLVGSHISGPALLRASTMDGPRQNADDQKTAHPSGAAEDSLHVDF